jgi:hypothetical protein
MAVNCVSIPILYVGCAYFPCLVAFDLLCATPQRSWLIIYRVRLEEDFYTAWCDNQVFTKDSGETLESSALHLTAGVQLLDVA